MNRVPILLFLLFATNALAVNNQPKNAVCPEFCEGASCCEVDTNELWCCPYYNGVCCPGRMHCCPQGSTCTTDSDSCQYPVGLIFGHKRLWKPKDQSVPEELKNKLSSVVICPDHQSACPTNTTCCPMSGIVWGCCPGADSVCCSDGLHCCPKGTRCNTKHLTCDPVAGSTSTGPSDILSVGSKVPESQDSQSSAQNSDVQSVPEELKNKLSSIVVCPDRKSACPTNTTCCPVSGTDWGCCPGADGLCCDDGEHCCPKGYQCNARDKTCTKLASIKPYTQLRSHSNECPNPEFRCDNGTTCCPLANDEWACCPFDNAVCCADQSHCCPENTSCDVKHGRCLRSGSSELSKLQAQNIPVSVFKTIQHLTCKDGVSFCPEGTSCCLNTAGSYSCCPFENAVCCSDKLHCCPNGMQCEETTGQCMSGDVISRIVHMPWLKKIPAHRSTPNLESKVESRDRVCPDGRSMCDGDHTCCTLINGNYGCCPYDDGVCCPDKMHCCPAGSTCGLDGFCVVPRLTNVPSALSMALRMAPTSRPAKLSNLHQSSENAAIAIPVRPRWCSDRCPNGELCCPDATNSALNMCCPAPGGMCCSDGQHCCPRGTQCVPGGFCEPEQKRYTASYLIGARQVGRESTPFLAHITPQSFDHQFAKPASKARPNLLYLLPRFRRLYGHRVTVCPDHKHTCARHQQCFVSDEFLCAPKGADCCAPQANTYCPMGSICSVDGTFCYKESDVTRRHQAPPA